MEKILSVALLSTLLLTACATAVHQDYDHSVDFSNYHSYAWAAPESHPVQDPVLDSQLLEERVMSALIDVMSEKKGYRQVEPQQADMLITYHTGSKDRLRESPFSVGIGYSRHYRFWNSGVFFGDSIQSYQEAVLIIDIVDAKTDKLIWRGWDTEVLSQENFNAEAINVLVERILSAFPPA